VIGASLGAGAAANAGVIVDDNLAADRAAMNGAGGAADHADRIHTVHAGIGDHEPVVLMPMPQKAGITVMGGGAGAHAVIAAGATVQVHHHGGGGIEKTVVHQKLDQLRLDAAMKLLEELDRLGVRPTKDQLLEGLG